MTNKTSTPVDKKTLTFGAIIVLVIGFLAWQETAGKNQPGTADEIQTNLQAYFSAMEENGDFSGVVLVSHGGERVFHQAFGFSDSESRTKTTLETGYPIASLTKTFVSGAILHLVNEEKLDLDDPVSKFFPNFPRADEITIRFLLLHASGLQDPNYLEHANLTDISPANLAAKIFAKPLLFDPGTTSQYSNAGYNVLAAIIEKVTGKTLNYFFVETFFEPLGFTGTENLISNGGVKGQAKGYLPGPAPSHVILSPLNNYSLLPGSGSLVATAEDLELWLGAVANKTYFDIFDPTFRWPYGWGKTEAWGNQGLEQSGAVDGYRAAFQLFPEANIKVIVLSNINSDNWVRWAGDAATIVLGGEAEPPLTPTPVPLEGDWLKTYTGSYLAEGWTLHLRNLNGHLWMFFDEFPVGKYLVPLGNHRFALAGATGNITFEIDTESGMATSLEWDFGDGSLAATKIEEK